MATGQAPEQTLLSLDEVICDGTAVCLARSIAWSEGHAPLCLCFLPIATISEVYDQAIVMGGVGILTRYAVYCNELKTHRSLGKGGSRLRIVRRSDDVGCEVLPKR